MFSEIFNRALELATVLQTNDLAERKRITAEVFKPGVSVRGSENPGSGTAAISFLRGKTLLGWIAREEGSSTWRIRDDSVDRGFLSIDAALVELLLPLVRKIAQTRV